MISIKFECPFCDKKQDYHLFYNLSFRMCEFKDIPKVENDSFVANCEYCGREVEFELLIKQISINSAGEAENGK